MESRIRSQITDVFVTLLESLREPFVGEFFFTIESVDSGQVVGSLRIIRFGLRFSFCLQDLCFAAPLCAAWFFLAVSRFFNAIAFPARYTQWQFQTRESPRQVSLLVVEDTQIIVGEEISRLKIDGFSVCLHRIFNPIRALISVSEIEASGKVLRIQTESPLKLRRWRRPPSLVRAVWHQRYCVPPRLRKQPKP